MNYTNINGKKLSNMSLGTVQLGMNYGIANSLGKPDEAKSNAMLRCAFENGVTSLDTARAYGNSEEVLGNFFKGYMPCEPAFITSKIIIDLPDTSTEKEVEAKMTESLEKSLECLGVDKLDCYMLHRGYDITRYNGIVPKIMEKFIKQNYISMAGVSIYAPEDLDEMQKHECFRATQVPMSLFDQKLITNGYISRLKEAGVSVFVRSVFLQGLFFLDPDTITDPLLVEYAVPHLKTLRRLCKEANMTIAEFAISFIRDVDGVTSLVLGADTKEQVMENIGYINAPSIPESIRKEAEETFQNVDLGKIMEVLSRPKK